MYRGVIEAARAAGSVPKRRTVRVSAYLPGTEGPGRCTTVPLDVVSRGRRSLVLPEVTVLDVRPEALLEPVEWGDIVTDPAGGGGPRRGPEDDHRARVFGLTNTAYHAQRMLRVVVEHLGHPLPPLVIRIGAHEEAGRWGGGHYRVRARSYAPPEAERVRVSGEVHLGGGQRYLVDADGAPYFGAPAHNLAIIYHEIGHHVVRHTADFRLNGLRSPSAQTNKKIPLDEGSCDFLTAIMLGHPDIYRWHRADQPTWSRHRRALSPRWTMAGFQGGAADPHTDGMIWSSACWTACRRATEAGHDPARVVRAVLRGLELSARRDVPEALRRRIGVFDHDDEETAATLKRRRYFSALLEAVLAADEALSEPVLAAMAEHGVRPGLSNVRLREACRPA